MKNWPVFFWVIFWVIFKSCESMNLDNKRITLLHRQGRIQGPVVRERESSQQRNYSHQAADHQQQQQQQRYSYAGYEPEREFKDYTRERELMLRQRAAAATNNQRGEYTARYVHPISNTSSMHYHDDSAQT